MTLRLLAAYSIIAALAASGLLALWIYALREPWARRGRRIRRARRSAEPRPTSNGHQPAFEAD